MGDTGRRFDWLSWAVGIALGLGFVAWGAAWVGNFIEDDTLITLRYAYRLLEGNGLTWNDGERVEGYSNLAWLLASAGLGALGIDLVLAARILAFACWGVTFGALAMLARRARTTWLGFAASAVALGATASLPVWAMGALEQPLVVASLAVALWAQVELVYSAESPGKSFSTWAVVEACALALLVLTRPDGPLFVAVLAVSTLLLVRRRAGSRAALLASGLVAGIPLLVWLAHLGFRLAYYGDWLPNTAYVKARTSQARVLEGLGYVGRGFWTGWLLTWSGAVGAVLALSRRKTRGLAIAVLALLATWVGYVVAIGGDHFPAFRHMLPAQLCMAVLLALGLGAWSDATGRWRWVPAGVVVAIGVLAIPYVFSQRTFSDINVAKRSRWQWDGQALGITFGRAFADEAPLWAVTAAGCLPYFSRLPALDLLGLNDAHIARQEPDPTYQLGHRHGDGAYVLGRAPDLITFRQPRGGKPYFKSGLEMAQDPRFDREYQRIRFQTVEPIAMWSETYVRRHGRVGIEATHEAGESDPSSVRVPGYLFRGAIGHPLPDGGLGALIERKKSVTVDLPRLAAGRYRVRLHPENPRVAVRVATTGRGALFPDGDDSRVFSLVEGAALRIDVQSKWLSTLLGALVIERLGPSSPSNADPHESLTVQASTHASDAGRSLFPEDGFGNWVVSGDAFGSEPSSEPREGQVAIEGARGRFFNSFRKLSPKSSGDVAQGVLSSPPFEVQEGMWIELRVGGGRAKEFIHQVGVRVVDVSGDAPETRMVFTGKRDEKLRRVRADLSPFAGSAVRIEVFDESSERWGHVIADGFTLHGAPEQR